MKINRYFPFAFIYFFVNSLGLPFGLTYTAILSPLFYWWILMERKKEVLVPFLVCLSPFLIAHAILGVNVKVYIISIVNFTAVYIFCQAFYTFLKTVEDIEQIFRRLLLINIFSCLINTCDAHHPDTIRIILEARCLNGIRKPHRQGFHIFQRNTLPSCRQDTTQYIGIRRPWPL